MQRNNLPAQLTSFVGRKKALAELTRLLPSVRLLTLIGAGGIGKTRLALQVAEAMERPDGVWLGNQSRYRSAELDALVDRYQATIPEGERARAMGDINVHVGEHLSLMGLTYGAPPI
jgi:hypothetical protein